MKRLNNLYSATYELNNIIEMTDKVCSRVRNKRKVDKFETYKSEHLLNIKNRLESKNIKIEKYNIFMINDPKYRIIMSLDIEDKIINHLIAKYMLVKVFENKYIDSMVATRTLKGTSYGIKLLKKYLNKIKKYNNFYILKIDISKYFYSIDHNVLKEILRKNIKDEDALNILNNIIDSTNMPYINEKITKLKLSKIKFLKESNINNKYKLIGEVEKIPLYEYGKGVCIGNQTSQSFGLIYLYELNHYIKEKLHIKYFVNYMDDFVILHEDKEYLKYCLKEIEYRLNNIYKLKINNNKTKINNIKEGIDFLGYRFYLKNNKVIIKIRNHTKKKFKRKAKELKMLINEGVINFKKFNLILSSYKGLLQYGDCKNLYYRNIKFITNR